MFRGRTPRTPVRPQSVRPVPAPAAVSAGRAAVGRAVEPVELLEARRLLTTLVGGQTFDYYDQAKQSVRIRLVGDITAEFTAARVRASDNSVVIRDLIPAPFASQTAPTEGADLFNIYIAEAGPDAQIIITKVSAGGTDDKNATPYSGSVGTIRANDNDPDSDSDTITPDSTGGVYIGTRTLDLTAVTGTDEADVPITFNRTRQSLGVRPAGRGLYAGIQSAPGVSMDKILIGGTITGIVNLGGSVKTFYAGNILTGDATGLNTFGTASLSNNFSVAGDLQNLYVGGSIGTTDLGFFRTGTQIRVGGRLGNVHVDGASTASVTVAASPDAPSITTPAEEAEYVLQSGEKAPIEFLAGRLSGAAVNNNSADTAPFMYASGKSQTMAWTGTLQNLRSADQQDNYSLPLLAGQSVQIQLTDDPIFAPGTGVIGVYDPLGRLVASDLPGPTHGGVGQQFLFTAKLPGIYRLDVSANQLGRPGLTEFLGDIPYVLRAATTGDVTFGGASVEGDTHFREASNGITVRTGDMGGWYGVGNVSGLTTARDLVASPITVSRGNLRAIYGANVGVEEDTNIDNEGELLDLTVPRGSVGYVHATAGSVAINPDAVDDSGDPVPAAAIGGDYQRVEASVDVDAALVANGSIGTIIAQGIDSNKTFYFQPTFSANTDQRGHDGDIDMIYVTGNVGASNISGAEGGSNQPGPALFNGLSGNIKYFHVGGTVRRDTFFGGSISTTQTYEAGRAIRLVDDSGVVALITPTTEYTTTSTGVTNAVNAGPTDTPPSTGVGTTPISNTDGTIGSITTVGTPGALTLTTYGVRGTGGVVLINAASTTSVRVTTLAGSTGGSFDITDLTTAASGSAVETAGTVDASGVITRGTTVGYPVAAADDTAGTGGTTTTATTLGNSPLRTNLIAFNGAEPVNVFHVTGNNVTTLANATDGEIASANLATVGNVTAKTLGRVTGSTESAVVVPTNLTGAGTGAGGFGTATDGFTQAIQVTGSALTIAARDGIGNVVSGETINSVQPNSDGRNARRIFDGIDGIISADNLNNVNIGEGLGYGGSGLGVQTGVFAATRLGSLVGKNADIRGPVLAGQTISNVTLNNGSIINARVGTLTSADQASFLVNSFTLSEAGDGFSLNAINITGDGGIIGSEILSGSFGAINAGGFGIIDSTIFATASNRSNGSINAGGLGIRFVTVDAGTSINSITATGNGRVQDVTQYSSRVRQTGGARRRRYDAYSGRLLDPSNDLNRLLGTSASTPSIRGVTNSGVIQDLNAAGNGNLGSVKAYAITSANTLTSLTSSLFPDRLVFANSIGSIDVAKSISGLSVRTGSLDSINVGDTIERASISAAGRIGSIEVGRTVRGSASIVAQGNGGAIGSLLVHGSLYGVVRSDGDIDSVAAGTLGAIVASSGSIGTIGIDGDVLTGSQIRARRTITKIVIDGDFQEGATIDAAHIGRLRVTGANEGTVTRG